MNKKKTYIGLEKEKVYIIKCRIDMMSEKDMRHLEDNLNNHGIQTIIQPVMKEEAITVQETTLDVNK